VSARPDRRFASLCADLHGLAQQPLDANGPARGWRWEERIAEGLRARGFPARSVAGGIHVHGVLPASGLRHQIDGEITCDDALVLGEWKAYHGPVPKNEMLRFKATSDDLYDEMASRRTPPRDVLRLFGVAGDGSPALRSYAARHGIALIERSRWPGPVLADPLLAWPDGRAPTDIDRQRLQWLSRPLQHVYERSADGRLLWPRRIPDPAVQALLAMQDRWSTRLSRLVARDELELSDLRPPIAA